VIQGVRTVRAEMKLDPKKKVAAEFSSADATVRGIVEANREGIERLGLLTELRVTAEKLREGSGGMRSTAQFDLQIPYPAETTDAGTEIARLKKEMEGLQKAIASKENQLGNETFRSRAPQNIIHQMEQALAGQRIELQKMTDRLKQLRDS
jgi:valyl-tRNA synthetase